MYTVTQRNSYSGYANDLQTRNISSSHRLARTTPIGLSPHLLCSINLLSNTPQAHVHQGKSHEGGKGRMPQVTWANRILCNTNCTIPRFLYCTSIQRSVSIPKQYSVVSTLIIQPTVIRPETDNLLDQPSPAQSASPHHSEFPNNYSQRS
jgi:hypothetical protein